MEDCGRPRRSLPPQVYAELLAARALALRALALGLRALALVALALGALALGALALRALALRALALAAAGARMIMAAAPRRPGTRSNALFQLLEFEIEVFHGVDPLV